MNILKSPYAKNSLKEHALYFEENVSLAIAERYLDAVEETLEFIQKQFEIGSPCEFSNTRLKNMRRWPVRDFENYLLFYQETEEGLTLLYVFHGRQDINDILENLPDED
jgi:plasmid stabilization system protein ParE